jgi:hypothetical protein
MVKYIVHFTAETAFCPCVICICIATVSFRNVADNLKIWPQGASKPVTWCRYAGYSDRCLEDLSDRIGKNRDVIKD